MIVSRAAASITGQHPEKNGVISQVFKVYVSEIFLSSLIALLSISHTRVSSNNRVRRRRVCVHVFRHPCEDRKQAWSFLFVSFCPVLLVSNFV